MKNEHNTKVAGSSCNLLNIISITALSFFILIVFFLLFADLFYLLGKDLSFADLVNLFTSEDIIKALWLSLITSLCSLALVIIFSIPIGYALSRFKFIGHTIINTIIDVPLVLPPVVIGISLLAFFGSPFGMEVKAILKSMNINLVSAVGIIMCQFLVSVSYCIRATKASFDSIDENFELVSLSLGASRMQAFWKVTLPLAKNGLIAGSVMAWARAIGVFGPLMVFVGTSTKVETMPTKMWLELSIGNIEMSIAIALIMVLISGTAIAIVHLLAPGKKWS